ncbi:unnamed protein product [Amoebophrya sp. A120]|nr:unnamed protein product [Amoebophrya sp. A120]|eukprot:GSA120T00021598001.1
MSVQVSGNALLAAKRMGVLGGSTRSSKAATGAASAPSAQPEHAEVVGEEHHEPEVHAEMYVDEAFRFAGPSTKKLANAKNMFRQRCWLLAFKCMKQKWKLEKDEFRISEQYDTIKELKRQNFLTKTEADARVADYKSQMLVVRENEKKVNEEMARLQERTLQLEQMLQATNDARNARETELGMMQSSMDSLLKDAKEAVRFEFREREKQIAEENMHQQEILRKEALGYKNKIVEVERVMRSRLQEERLKLAEQLLQERKLKIKERMQRMTMAFHMEGKDAAHDKAMADAKAEKDKEVAAAKAAGGGGKKEKKKLQKQELKESQVNQNPEKKEEIKAAPAPKAAPSVDQVPAPAATLAEEIAPRLTEEDIRHAIDACEERFELERQKWQDERAELRLMYEQKALLHAQQQCDKVARYNELAERNRELERLVVRFKEIERLHIKQTQSEKNQRLHTLHRVTRMAQLAREENLGPLEEIKDVKDLRARAEAVVKLKALEDPTHRIARLIAGEKRMRHPTLNPTLLEAPKTETEQLWELFGSLRELDQSAADLQHTPQRGAFLEPDPPVYTPDYAFEKLYTKFPHNLPDIDEYNTAVSKLRRAKDKIATMNLFGGGSSSLAAGAGGEQDSSTTGAGPNEVAAPPTAGTSLPALPELVSEAAGEVVAPPVDSVPPAEAE